MRRFLPHVVLVVLIAAAGAGLYLSAHPERVAELSNFSLTPPCSKPIPYTIGAIDPRFALTETEVLEKLNEAATLWNQTAGKPLFVYAPNDRDTIPVNFVYDQRQQTVALSEKISTVEASQDVERRAIETAQSNYLASQQAYADAVAAFNTASQAYAKEVQRVNSSGGADAATYARLSAQKDALKKEQQELETRSKALNTEGDALKRKIAAFNASVHDINTVVSAFNTTAGGDFEEGLYVQEASGARRIDIYAYKNESELIHSLAHEFGHALGLDHNSGPISIMFPYNKSGVTLSEADMIALGAACQ